MHACMQKLLSARWNCYDQVSNSACTLHEGPSAGGKVQTCPAISFCTKVNYVPVTYNATK